jgi:NAD(P)-dependent dehydrogenase (short-subunit alcohol dehydrogenase family)
MGVLQAGRGGVVVTGGAGGIGAAVAARFASAGYGVVVSDVGVTVDGNNPTSTAADQVVAAIVAAGGRAVAHYGSVTQMAVAEDLVSTAVNRYGCLAAMVTCQGILRERMIFNMTEEEWDSVVAVHLKGTFACFRFATAQMRRQRDGSIVSLTSAAGLEGSPAQANYAAAKAGIVGLSLSTALAMGRYGTNVNCIVPSASTRMTARLTDTMAGSRPAEERQGPELIAELAVVLADPANRGITGQVLTAAGRRLGRWQQATEVASVEVGSAIGYDEVAAAVRDRLGVDSLRRFAALGLAEPTAVAVGHAAPAGQ